MDEKGDGKAHDIDLVFNCWTINKNYLIFTMRLEFFGFFILSILGVQLEMRFALFDLVLQLASRQQIVLIDDQN